MVSFAGKRIKVTSKQGAIPTSLFVASGLASGGKPPKSHPIKLKRLLFICLLAILNAMAAGVIAKLMLELIGLLTSVFFYGAISPNDVSPVGNHLGLWVILIPVIGGIIVSFMARYGSTVIRGHGIPEAMEQVLAHESKIPPIVTLLKPLSAAISIGTGGPFGAEGPIIVAGGALGSLIGQVLKVTAYERKILLTAGATAGMAAIFGCPVAAILFAIELLLFEFSPRSIIPVALACITGAAAHIIFFGFRPMFEMPVIDAPDTTELLIYIGIGLVLGVASVGVTKMVYKVEDLFERTKINWMWWPAFGGLAVGIVGYFAPITMGVGYSNIRNVLNGNTTLQVLLVLSFLKLISWAVSLGSGTSGSTLAPLFTIGGAMGALIAWLINYFFPASGISLPLAGLMGMAALFSGASRALLASVVFAIETTGEPHILLPLLGGCAASYFVSFIMMRSTIMTEKIARRGIATPDSYVPDILSTTTVRQALKEEVMVLSETNTVGEIRGLLDGSKDKPHSAFVVVDNDGGLQGVVDVHDVFSSHYNADTPVKLLLKEETVTVTEDELLESAVHKMTKNKLDILPVMNDDNNSELVGVLSYHDILEAYERRSREQEEESVTISVRKQTIQIFEKGRHFFLRR